MAFAEEQVELDVVGIGGKLVDSVGFGSVKGLNRGELLVAHVIVRSCAGLQDFEMCPLSWQDLCPRGEALEHVDHRGASPRGVWRREWLDRALVVVAEPLDPVGRQLLHELRGQPTVQRVALDGCNGRKCCRLHPRDDRKVQAAQLALMNDVADWFGSLSEAPPHQDG